MKLILLLYRAVYASFLVIVLAGILRDASHGQTAKTSEIVLFWLFVCALVFAVFAAFAFQRIPELLFYSTMAALCALFAWYGWYSSAAPFAQHELHTFDPIKAATESSRYRAYSWIGYAVMVLWLLSLPIIRSVYVRRLRR